MPREDEYDYRWLRIGWFTQGRPCDAIVQYVTAQLPGETMPQRWTESDPISFVEKHGKGLRWSQTMSYHMLILDGTPLFRIWTNAKKTTLIEVTSALNSQMMNIVDMEVVPAGTRKKRNDFAYRFRATCSEEIAYLIALVRDTYGLEE